MSNNRAYRILFFVIVIYFLTSCQKIAKKDNEYFGELPHIFEKHQSKVTKLERESKLTSSVGKSLEINSKLKKLNKKFQRVYKKEYNKIKFPVHLPFEGQINFSNYQIQDVYVSDITVKGRVKIVAKAYANQNNICPFTFARFVDKKNNPVGENAYIILTLPNYNHGHIEKNSVNQGEQFNLEGFYPTILDLSDMKKVVFISEQAYFNNE